MTVPNFMSKAFSYQDLRSGRGKGEGALCAPLPRGMIRQNTPVQIGLNKPAAKKSRLVF